VRSVESLAVHVKMSHTIALSDVSGVTERKIAPKERHAVTAEWITHKGPLVDLNAMMQ